MEFSMQDALFVGGSKVADNGQGFGEEGELNVQMFNSLLMPNRSTMFKVCTSAPFLPNPCYMPFLSAQIFNF
jgi:hypothetical protein